MKHFIRFLLVGVMIGLLLIWAIREDFFTKVMEKTGGLKPVFSIEDSQVFDKAENVEEGDISMHSIEEPVTKLQIDAGGCQFILHESEEGSFYVTAKNAGKFQCYTKNEELFIKITRSGKDLKDVESCEVDLWIPKGFVFDEAKLELGAGSMFIESLRANTLECKVGAGAIHATQLICDSFAGDIGLGSLEADLIESGKITGTVGMGNLNLTLVGKETDYNFLIESALGHVKIGEEEFSEIKKRQEMNHGSEKDVKLDCAIGNITLGFSERDVL